MAQPALAAGPSECKVRFLQFVRNRVMPHIVPNPSRSILNGIEASDWQHPHDFEMKVGGRIAFGMKGGVFRIEAILGLPQADVYTELGVRLVLKSSHRGKRTGLLRTKYQRVLKEEKLVYDALQGGFPSKQMSGFRRIRRGSGAIFRWCPSWPMCTYRSTAMR